jgi:hypothetical protein
MICWADITLPSSRVRSDALRTNLFKRALLGRSVMGTVSGSLGLIFFALERVGIDSATDPLAAGVEDTNAGAGAELVPAGCWPLLQFGRPIHWSRDSSSCGTLAVIVRWGEITIPRLRSIATPCSYECTVLQRFAVVALQ